MGFMILRGLAVALFGVVCCMIGGSIGDVTGMIIAAFAYTVAVVWIGVERVVVEIRMRREAAPLPGHTAAHNEERPR